MKKYSTLNRCFSFVIVALIVFGTMSPTIKVFSASEFETELYSEPFDYEDVSELEQSTGVTSGWSAATNSTLSINDGKLTID